MKKQLSLISLFVVLIITLSANNRQAQALSVGDTAPGFELKNSDSTLSLESLKGKYALVSIWSSTDPASRIAIGDYDRLSARNLIVISVNSDRNPKLFKEIVRRDGLENAKHFALAGQSPEFREKFSPTGAAQTYLIDPEGEIAAINPTVAELNSILGSRVLQ